MAWDTYTGDLSASVIPIVTKLEALLTAHAAWTHVEDATEYLDRTESGSGLDYHAETYTIRVWKNSGSANGTGHDFYLTITTAVTFTPDSGQIVTGTHTHFGAVWLNGMESWDSTTHKAKHIVGTAIKNSLSVIPDMPAPEYRLYPDTESWYLVQASVSADGLSFGTYGTAFENDIASLTPNPNQYYGIWDWNYYPCIQAAESGVEDPTLGGATDGYSLTAVMRVTSKGVFLWGGQILSGPTWTNVGWQYVGMGDESRRVPEFQSGYPLMAAGSDQDYKGTASDLVAQSRFPEVRSIQTWLKSTSIDCWYGWQWNGSTTSTARNKGPYPGYTDFAAMPIGSKSGPSSYRNFDYDSSDPGIIIPGFYLLSSQGGPFRPLDTILSPEGHACVIINSTTNVTNTPYIAVDTELT